MKKHLFTKKHQTKLTFGHSIGNEFTNTHLFILKSKLFHPYDSINLHIFLSDEKMQSQTTGYYSISAFDQMETVDGNCFNDSEMKNDFNSSKTVNSLIIKKIAVA